MEPEKMKPSVVSRINQKLPRETWALAGGAAVIGFVVGSGRWMWFGKRVGRIAGTLGETALDSISAEFERRNPQLFNRR
jgi:hypothetical protein